MDNTLLGYTVKGTCKETVDTRPCDNKFLIFNITGFPKEKITVQRVSPWTNYFVTISVYNKFGSGPKSNASETVTLEQGK